jgi:UPF0755 protein
MIKKILWFFFAMLLVGGGWAAHVAMFYYRIPFPPTQPFSTAAKEIPIIEGSSFKVVSDLLSSHGLVANSLYFRLLGKWTRNDNKIKPGVYAFHAAMRPMEILNKLIAGETLETQVIIREGLTSSAIADILEEAGLVSADEFNEAVADPTLLIELGMTGDSLEGYLFPATYLFPKGAGVRDVAKRLVNEFRTRFDDSLRDQAEQMGMTELEVVTLASIIDKETAASSERPIISAVFHNRLKLGMRLQSDPTVIFGIKNFNGNLTRKDLHTHTPYNTYTIPGLPPGPISNPGEDALRAAVAPAEVDYLYFVSKNNGTHYFSETLEEHNMAINLYQRKNNKRETNEQPL